MATFVVLKDRFNDQHAAEIHGEANAAAIERTARDLADDLGLRDCAQDDVLVGTVNARDAGDARIRRASRDMGADGGIVWHAWLLANGTYEACS